MICMAGVGDSADHRAYERTDRGDTEHEGGVIPGWTAHLASQATAEVGQELPPHSSQCVGCGPDNPAGLALHVVRTATGVEAIHSFCATHVGAPGIAHGGAVALAFDDLFGFALYTVGSLAVTRSLTIEYHAPFRLHRPYTFHAQVRNQEGRRLLLDANAWDPPAQSRDRPLPPSSWCKLDTSRQAPSEALASEMTDYHMRVRACRPRPLTDPMHRTSRLRRSHPRASGLEHMNEFGQSAFDHSRPVGTSRRPLRWGATRSLPSLVPQPLLTVVRRRDRRGCGRSRARGWVVLALPQRTRMRALRTTSSSHPEGPSQTEVRHAPPPCCCTRSVCRSKERYVACYRDIVRRHQEV